MKTAGKKIPKGTVLLFLSFAAISLCLLLIVSVTRAEKINSMGKSGMYSGHQENFSVSNAESGNLWDDVIPSLASGYNNFAVYLPIQDPEIVLRGVCVKGRVEVPPMIEGKYFDFDTSWSDSPKAVIGKQFMENVVKRDGKMYYDYQGMEFEVTGIMGTKEDSRINYMMMIDFKSAVRIAGINNPYVLDAGKRSDIQEIGQELDGLFRYPAEVIILLDGESNTSLIARLLSEGAIMDTMYMMVLISFSLSTVLVTFIWLRFRRQLFYAWQLCGYENRMQCMEISKRFYLVAGVGFMAGLLMLLLMSLIMGDVQLIVLDVLQAFGITIGLGTVILFFCYAFDRKNAK